MVQFCCIIGCGNRSNRERDKKFYRLPNIHKKCDRASDKADIILMRRKQWLMNIKREDLKDGDEAYSPGYIKVCSDHFVSGKPSVWSDVDSVDWAPSLYLGYDNTGKSIVVNRVKSRNTRGQVPRLKTEKLRRQRLRNLMEKKKLLDEITPHSESNDIEVRKPNTLKTVKQQKSKKKRKQKQMIDQKQIEMKEQLEVKLEESQILQKDSTDTKPKFTVNPLIHRISLNCIIPKAEPVS